MIDRLKSQIGWGSARKDQSLIDVRRTLPNDMLLIARVTPCTAFDVPDAMSAHVPLLKALSRRFSVGWRWWLSCEWSLDGQNGTQGVVWEVGWRLTSRAAVKAACGSLYAAGDPSTTVSVDLTEDDPQLLADDDEDGWY